MDIVQEEDSIHSESAIMSTAAVRNNSDDNDNGYEDKRQSLSKILSPKTPRTPKHHHV